MNKIIDREPGENFAKFFGPSTPGSSGLSATLRGRRSLPLRGQKIETFTFKIDPNHTLLVF